VLKSLFSKLYRPNSIKSFSKLDSLNNPSWNYYLQSRLKSNAIHPGINSVFLYTFAHESIDKVIICQEFNKHTALSLSRFHSKTTLLSPTLGRGGGFGAKDLRLRFVVYQLLQALAFIHSKGIVLHNLDSSGITLDDNLWLMLPFSLSDRTCMAIADQRHFRLSVPRTVDGDVPLTTRWLDGKLSNFEYLMAINHAAGRTMIDPLYHPILPWVTDFTTEFVEDSHDAFSSEKLLIGMRDLSKTKFRLSKGDPQLQTTFRHSDPPHHIPESLSELTYYIYLARRTPLQVLRRVVRDVFVPEHYPSSIARMYDWTPDECIPEFYMDCTVFHSIHKDLHLQDLELPAFLSSSEEFITYHRRVFESDYVSQRLHQWIDITFGYCLEGDQAVAHMNVPLKQTLSSTERLGDIASLEKHPGFCVLFKQPHPQKRIRRFKIKSHTQAQTKTDLMAFINLDLKSSNSKSRRKYEKKMNSFESSASTTSFNPFANLANNTTTISNRGVNHQPRPQSLNLAYDSEASWLALDLADDIDIKNKSCQSLQTQREEHIFQESFAKLYRPELTPSYVLPQSSTPSIADSEVIRPKKIPRPWDYELLDSIQRIHSSSSSENKEYSFLEQCMSDDMFAVGCIIAELYIGRPLLSENDTAVIKQLSKKKDGLKLATEHVMSIVYGLSSSNTSSPSNFYAKPIQKSQSSPGSNSEEDPEVVNPIVADVPMATIPLQICRLLTLLLQPDPSTRPAASEILQACAGQDIDSWSKRDVAALRTGGSKPGYIDFSNTSQHSNEICQPSQRLDLMDLYCSSIFPSYFRNVYKLIGLVRLTADSLQKFRLVVNHLPDLLVLPLEGVSLALPHVLEIIADSSPFKLQNSLSSSLNDLQHYTSIIDVIGLRLGTDATEKLIMPKVVEFLNALNSPFALQSLLSTSTLWHTLIIRGGARSFLRYFLPMLFTYLSSGTLQSISYGQNQSPGMTSSAGAVSPLWATMGITDKTEWLHLCKKTELRSLQEVAVLVISSLVDPSGLGPGLTSRFVIPPLMSLIGSPQFSVAGYNISEDQSIELTAEWDKVLNEMKSSDGRSHSPNASSRSGLSEDVMKKVEDSLEALLSAYTLKCTQDTYTVHAIVALCSNLGELITSELVLRRICDEILPSLEPLFAVANPALSTISAIMEIVLLLNGVLPNLSPETINKYYLKSRQNSYSLPELLTVLSLSNLCTIGDDLLSSKPIADINVYLQSDRRFALLLEIIRLIVSTSMIVGNNATIEHVLPAVDKFFGSFVEVLGKLPIHSKLLFRAFELGAELYLPLENITGGVFSAAVPNLNPKLEVWLTSIGSGSETRRSPPLPNNILPEVVVDHSTNDQKKKKGMFAGWMSSSSSSSSSKTASTATTTSYPSISSMIYPSKPMPPTPSSLAKPPHEVPWAKTQSTNRQSLTNRSSMEALDQPETKQTYPDNDNDPYDRMSNAVNSTEYSPVAAAVMTAPPRSTFTIQTPFGKIEGNTDTTVKTHLSATEGMELKAIDKNHPEQSSPLTGRSLNFNRVDSSGSAENSRKLSSEVVDSDDEDPTQAPIPEASIEKDDEEAYLSAKESIDELEAVEPAIDITTKPGNYERDISTTSSVPDSPTKLDEVSLIQPEANPISTSNESSSSKPAIMPSKLLAELLAGYVRPRGASSTTSGSHRQRGSSITRARKRDIIHHVVTRGSMPKRNSDIDSELDEEMYQMEVAWLLAGYGPQASHASNGQTYEHVSQSSTITSQSTAATSIKARASRIATASFGHLAAPSAQISMTAPRIAVDAASEAGSLFSLSMTVHCQFRDKDNLSTHPSSNLPTTSVSSSNQSISSAIRSLTVNATESLLISTSRTGTKLWSLNTFPISQVAKYHNSGDHAIPFSTAFLRTGSHIATCDGSINIWDIETSRVVSYVGHSPLQSPFYSMYCSTSRYGISPGLQAMGDDQILTCSNNFTINHYDYRSSSRMNNLKAISDWQLPGLPFLPSSQISTFSASAQMIEAVSSNHLTTAISSEHYVIAGSNNGGLWVVDRRTGRCLAAWQGHDSCILKIACLDEHHFLSIAERSAYVWSYSSSTPIKISSVKNLPESSSTPLTPNTTIIAAFESSHASNHSYLSPDLRLAQQQHVLYGIAGHKMYGCRIKNSFDTNSFAQTSFWSSTGSPLGVNQQQQERPCYSMGSYREAIDLDEVKLTQSYFMDRHKNKISKPKLITTSAALLPLRRLLLLGGEDGAIHVVS
jgi:hypothetical protein